MFVYLHAQVCNVLYPIEAEGHAEPYLGCVTNQPHNDALDHGKAEGFRKTWTLRSKDGDWCKVPRTIYSCQHVGGLVAWNEYNATYPKRKGCSVLKLR